MDVFCLLRLWAAGTVHFLPKFAWAVLVVCISPFGGLGLKAWFGPAAGGYGRSPASPEGHAVGVVAIAAAVYLVLAGQVLAASAVAVALVIIVFLKATSPDSATVTRYARDEFQARKRPATWPAGP